MADYTVGGRFILLPDVRSRKSVLEAAGEVIDTREAANNSINYDAVIAPGNLINATEGFSTENYGGAFSLVLDAQNEVLQARRSDLEAASSSLQVKMQEKGVNGEEELMQKLQEGDEDLRPLFEAVMTIQKEIGEESLEKAYSNGFTLDHLLGGVRSEYEGLKPSFENLASKVPIFSICGGQDTLLAYEVLDQSNGGPLQFVEYKKAGVTLSGINGLDWFVQGDTNTAQRSNIAGMLNTLCGWEGKEDSLVDILINYNSGLTVNEENKGLMNDANYRLGMASGRILTFSQSVQKNRLDDTVLDADGNPKKADLFISSNPIYNALFGTGDVALEYGVKSNTVFSGNEPVARIGNLIGPAIDQAIQASTETCTVEGYDGEVPVFYFDVDESGVPQLNCGPEYMFEVIYDDQKQVQEVIIYDIAA